MQWLTGTLVALLALVLIFEVATGRLKLRDERGRPKPSVAALIAMWRWSS